MYYVVYTQHRGAKSNLQHLMNKEGRTHIIYKSSLLNLCVTRLKIWMGIFLWWPFSTLLLWNFLGTDCADAQCCKYGKNCNNKWHAYCIWSFTSNSCRNINVFFFLYKNWHMVWPLWKNSPNCPFSYLKFILYKFN